MTPRDRSAALTIARGENAEDGVSELPSGTVTFVFTDIEGSTRLLASLGASYEDALATHRRLLRNAFSAHAGVEVDTQGDALFYGFTRAHDALAGVLAAQRALASHPWPENGEVRVRVGIHTGEPTVTEEGYVGADVHLGARICGAAWGGQILVSDSTARLLGDIDDGSLRDLGEFSLKDIDVTQRLHQIDAPGLRADFPPPRTVPSHPTNLPPTLPTLVGRAEDISELMTVLGSDDVRVVTVTGPGGVGKTRLALATGAALLSSFADGVFFVYLSSLSDPSLVVGALAATLGLRESSGRSLSETLSDYLASRQVLLILDNLEHLLDAAADISGLVTSAPSLKVLVTSREPLRIAGEHEVPLAPLDLPPQGADATAIVCSPAVELFVARARAVRPGFTPTGDDASSVAQICRRVDGLPLAIELAAAGTKVLSLPALANRLDQSLAALGQGRRDASDRQRTLRGAISWSYGLLSPDEQALFRRLGVFAGGFTLEAAEEVCDRGDLSLDVLDGLVSLVDKSLVRAREQEDRFVMLETIRSFASDELDASGEAEEIRRAHADNFRSLAEEAAPELVGAAQREWLDRLERDHDNLRATLQWSLTADKELAVATVAHVSRFWYVRGYLSEGRTWLERALESSSSEPTAPTLRIASMLGVIAHVQGDLNAARSFAQRGVALALALQDDQAVMHCTETMALGELEQGRFAEARRHFEDNLRLSRALKDERGAAVTIGNLAFLGLLEGDHKGAAALVNESFAWHRKAGDEEGMARGATLLGISALLASDVQQAKSYLQEGVELAADVGHKELIGTALGGFAAAAAHTGELERAAILLGAAARMREDSGIALDPLEHQLDEKAKEHLLDSLTEERVNELFAKGAAMSMDEVLRYIHD